MALHWIDWTLIAGYVVFALAVGVVYARRAGKDVDEYFLSGRSLPWWIAGTSMVATSFAADTPLVITGWVRDHGIWKNWVWWCYCGGGMLSVFLFARGWRRGGVMTKAELAELRYGGEAAAVLRGILGFMHAGVTNTITLCWVLLAAKKIMEVLLGIDGNLALVLGCAIALVYSLMAGFWGVVVTDLVQFVMAMVGAVALAWLAWAGVGGTDAVLAAAARGAPFTDNTLRFLPETGPGGPFDASFWTIPLAALAVYLGVSWWAAENVDGSGTAVQRIAASKDEREGVLAVMWYNVTHYAMRPWPWILVALASLVALPPLSVTAPAAGEVVSVTEAPADGAPAAIELRVGGGELLRVPLDVPGSAEDWGAIPRVAAGDAVEEGALLAASDSERAYVVMMRRYLPVGLLGLVVASLLAAFMSTIDTHVNLAASFFVNDLWRRFVVRDGSPHHYVRVARIASVVVLALAGLLASQASSISDLFLFFLAFLGGVGPIYVLRWHWWRVSAWTEIAAMLSSALTTTYLTFSDHAWSLGPFSDGGALLPEGRLLIVVAVSLSVALAVTLLLPRPDPAGVLGFYRTVRPAGWWGPVAALAPEVRPVRHGLPVALGILGGIALVYGSMLALGLALLDRGGEAAAAGGAALVGAVLLLRALRSEESQARPDGVRVGP
jgi:SSS family solute:Na+ symporter